jgi:hypothetical protein
MPIRTRPSTRRLRRAISSLAPSPIRAPWSTIRNTSNEIEHSSSTDGPGIQSTAPAMSWSSRTGRIRG